MVYDICIYSNYHEVSTFSRKNKELFQWDDPEVATPRHVFQMNFWRHKPNVRSIFHRHLSNCRDGLGEASLTLKVKEKNRHHDVLDLGVLAFPHLPQNSPMAFTMGPPSFSRPRHVGHLDQLQRGDLRRGGLLHHRARHLHGAHGLDDTARQGRDIAWAQ